VLLFTLHEKTDDALSQLSAGGMLVGGQSLKCIGFNFCCTAANITATLAASMALSADTDDDACEGPTANATAGRT
jgi:hypothetical protein